MSFSRIVIFDKSGLREDPGYNNSEKQERSLLVRNKWDYNEYFNADIWRRWDSSVGPYPTPFINLIQKKP